MRTGTRGTGRTTLTRTLRTRSGTPARASSPLSRFEFPPSAISNRQWLARLENTVNRGKQTPEASSNRHIRDGRQIRNACSLQIPASISPRLGLSPFSISTFPSSVAARRSFSIFTFPFSNAPRGASSDISNRQWLRRLETMSNPLKIKADHDF